MFRSKTNKMKIDIQDALIKQLEKFRKQYKLDNTDLVGFIGCYLALNFASQEISKEKFEEWIKKGCIAFYDLAVEAKERKKKEKQEIKRRKL